MINFIVAVDNEDVKLGGYFLDTTEFLIDIINENDPKKIVRLETPNCRTAFINSEVEKLNNQPFIFVGNCHGNEDALVSGCEPFIKINVNDHIFGNSIFIANSCLAGKNLGASLNRNGCKVFLGFNKTIGTFVNVDYKRISISCDNYFILKFLREDINAIDAFELLKKHYDWHIDRLNDAKDMLFAADLADIKESLQFLVNENVRKQDLYS